jgi:hypothetical protein
MNIYQVFANSEDVWTGGTLVEARKVYREQVKSGYDAYLMKYTIEKIDKARIIALVSGSGWADSVETVMETSQ